MNTALPEAIGIADFQDVVPGVRRIPRIDPADVATRLLGAMAREGDILSALLAELAGLVECSTTALWRRDDRGRLLLARKHGDEQLSAPPGQGRSLVAESDDGSPLPACHSS